MIHPVSNIAPDLVFAQRPGSANVVFDAPAAAAADTLQADDDHVWKDLITRRALEKLDTTDQKTSVTRNKLMNMRTYLCLTLS